MLQMNYIKTRNKNNQTYNNNYNYIANYNK